MTDANESGTAANEPSNESDADSSHGPSHTVRAVNRKSKPADDATQAANPPTGGTAPVAPVASTPIAETPAGPVGTQDHAESITQVHRAYRPIPPAEAPVAPTPLSAAGNQPSASAFDRIIPQKNGDSLAAYYCGLFSIIPLVGLFLGPFAIQRGSRALGNIKENPELPGKTHAGIGIGCGSLGLILNLILLVIIITAVASFK